MDEEYPDQGTEQDGQDLYPERAMPRASPSGATLAAGGRTPGDGRRPGRRGRGRAEPPARHPGGRARRRARRGARAAQGHPGRAQRGHRLDRSPGAARRRAGQARPGQVAGAGRRAGGGRPGDGGRAASGQARHPGDPGRPDQHRRDGGARVRLARRAQAGRGARGLRGSGGRPPVSRAARRAWRWRDGRAWTRARPPAGSPTCCCGPAPRTWWRPTWATASWPGRCGPTRGSPCWTGLTCGPWTR